MGIYDRPYYQDESSPNIHPTWDQRSAVGILIILSVIVFFADLIFTGANHAIHTFLALSSEDWNQPWMLWRSLTYGFVHSYRNPGHIVFNMFGLWMLGRAVEQRYGRGEFFRIYLLSIVVCGLLWLVLRKLDGSQAMVSGASGAVCCIQMLYVLNFPRATLLFFGIIPMQAWVLGLIFIFLNLMQGSAGLSGGQGEAVAWDIHLIGIAFAAIYFYGKWNLAFLAAPTAGWRAFRRRWFGPKLRAFQPDKESPTDEEEADRILDKIHRLGQDSLTPKEKRFLTRYSKSVREKRQNSEF